MKKPTTPFSIALKEKMQINKEFLTENGWILKEDKPLFETYYHSKNDSVECVIGLYGELTICELHWINKTPDKVFSTLNPHLTKEDFNNIISMLRISI